MCLVDPIMLQQYFVYSRWNSRDRYLHGRARGRHIVVMVVPQQHRSLIVSLRREGVDVRCLPHARIENIVQRNLPRAARADALA